MIIDGKQLAEEIMVHVAQVVATLATPPTLHIVVVGVHPVIDRFVRIKQRYAVRAGIQTTVHHYDSSINQEELLKSIQDIASLCQNKGDSILVQLPLPEHIQTKEILNSVPLICDVDMLSDRAHTAFVEHVSLTMPPVAGAVWQALASCGTLPVNPTIVVVGRGMLVGTPVTELLQHHGYNPVVIDKSTTEENRREFLQRADVIICGAGDPWFLLPEYITEGVILIDAGTSESENSVKGDVHPDCYAKARFYTPVPGGIGPLTVAMVFDNMRKIVTQ